MPGTQTNLLISLPDGHHVHGFINTGLAQRLVEAPGVQCTFLISPGAEACVPEALRDQARWLSFPDAGRALIPRLAFLVRIEASEKMRGGTDWELIRRRSPQRAWLRKCLWPAIWLVSRFPRAERLVQVTEDLLSPSPLKRTLRPQDFDAVVLGSAGIKTWDRELLRVFRRSKARRFGVVYSWDNLTSKTDCFSRCDHLAVWNETMKASAVSALGYAAERVAVVGAAQFDVYDRFVPPRDRAAFLQAMGMPGDARYVLYSGVPRTTTPWNEAYIQHMLDALPGHHVLFRIHPQDHAGHYAALARELRVHVFDSSAAGGVAFDRQLGYWVPHIEQATLLAEQLFHGDVTVNVASTVTLEASRMRRPVINIAYDAVPGTYPVSMAEYYQSRHYQQVARSGAVAIAYAREELAHLLATVEQWWPAHQPRGEALNRRIDPYCDGHAADRLAEQILAFVAGDARAGQGVARAHGDEHDQAEGAPLGASPVEAAPAVQARARGATSSGQRT